MTSSPHSELALRSRVARFVQLVVGIPAALAGIALLVAAAVVHHDHPVLGIVFGELGAVLLSLSILHLLYERLLREEYNRETVELLKRDVYPKFEAFAPLADAHKLGLSAVKEDFDMAEVLKRIKQAQESVVIVGAFFAWGEHLRQMFVDLANRGCTVDMFLLSNEVYSSQRREDASGETGLGKSMLESGKVFFANTKDRIAEPQRGNLRLWGYPSLPYIFLFQFDHKLIYAGFYLTGRNAEESIRLEVQDPESAIGQFFRTEIEHVRERSELLA